MFHIILVYSTYITVRVGYNVVLYRHFIKVKKQIFFTLMNVSYT